MTENKDNQELEDALLAEEREIDGAADERAVDRDIQAFEGFGSAGVAPAKLGGVDYTTSLD